MHLSVELVPWLILLQCTPVSGGAFAKPVEGRCIFNDHPDEESGHYNRTLPYPNGFIDGTT